MNLLTSGQLLVGAYAAFAPISWLDDGEPAGRDIAFLRLFAEQHGLALQVRFFPFDGLWERPGRDECDVAAAGLAPLPSRRYPGVVWSRPYFTVQRALLVRAEQPQVCTIADLAGQTIAVTRGSTAEDDVLARKPASARVVYTVDQRQSLEELAAGTIDAYATGDAGASYLAERSGERFLVADVHPFRLPERFAFPLRAASGVEAAINAFIEEHRERY
jgi:polar amino acid transport system substrate-binding protein